MRMASCSRDWSARNYLRGVARGAGVGSALLVSSCYGAIGPSVGFVRNGPVTLGWELSGVTATVGSSYALGTAGERPWRTRTFVAWEPRVGLPTRNLDGSVAGGFPFLGLGGTIGAHWDTVDGATAPPKAQFLGGTWVGGGYAFPISQSGCDDAIHPYVSFAFGMRGDEVYLTPKVGVLDVPTVCISAF
jgi:hypothetical protein